MEAGRELRISIPAELESHYRAAREMTDYWVYVADDGDVRLQPAEWSEPQRYLLEETIGSGPIQRKIFWRRSYRAKSALTPAQLLQAVRWDLECFPKLRNQYPASVTFTTETR